MHLKPRPIHVAIRHGEPLLSIGIHAALQNRNTIHLIPPDDVIAEPYLNVLVTDWDGGMAIAEGKAKPSMAHARVLVISHHMREPALRTVLRQGVHGVLLPDCAPGELVTAVQTLAQGRSYICAEVAQRLAAGLAREPLTTREEEVLALLARGQCNKSIAGRLGIAIGTVKTHVKAILGKLAASSRTEAVSIAAELGMVESAAWPPSVGRHPGATLPAEVWGYDRGMQAA